MLPTVLRRWFWFWSYFGFSYGQFRVESWVLVLFSILITSLGEKGAVLYASCAFVCLSFVRYFLFFLVSRVACGL